MYDLPPSIMERTYANILSPTKKRFMVNKIHRQLALLKIHRQYPKVLRDFTDVLWEFWPSKGPVRLQPSRSLLESSLAGCLVKAL